MVYQKRLIDHHICVCTTKSRFLAVFESVSDDKYFFLMIIKVSEFHLQFHEQSQFVVNVLLFTYKKC